MFELVNVEYMYVPKGDKILYISEDWPVSNLDLDDDSLALVPYINYLNHPDHEMFGCMYRTVLMGKTDTFSRKINNNETIPEWSILDRWPQNTEDIGYDLPIFVDSPENYQAINLKPLDRNGPLAYEVDNIGVKEVFESWKNDIFSFAKNSTAKNNYQEFLTLWEYKQSGPDYFGDYGDPEWNLIGRIDNNKLINALDDSFVKN